MSIIAPTTPDYDTLALALLPAAKLQVREETTFHDAVLTDMLRRAIAQFETVSGMLLNPGVWGWLPASAEFVDSRAKSPITPMMSWTATIPGDPDPVDVSADYTMTTPTVSGAAIWYLGGTWQADLMLSITSGFTVTTLPPGIRDVVLEMTATNFEHRELLVPSGQLSPQWLEQKMGPWWVPRV